jgi:hypothetical protein
MRVSNQTEKRTMTTHEQMQDEIMELLWGRGPMFRYHLVPSEPAQLAETRRLALEALIESGDVVAGPCGVVEAA